MAMHSDCRPAEFERCFLADALPGEVIEVDRLKDAKHAPAVVVELMDYYARVATEVQPDGKILPEYIQYFLHPVNARKMCCHLIRVLAKANDPVAIKLSALVSVLLAEHEDGKAP